MNSNQIPGLTFNDGYTKGREFGVKEIRDLVALIIKFPVVEKPEDVLEQIDIYITAADKLRKETPNGTQNS